MVPAKLFKTYFCFPYPAALLFFTIELHLSNRRYLMIYLLTYKYLLVRDLLIINY